MECKSSTLTQNAVVSDVSRFLWVAFQLDELCEALSDAAIRKTLRTLPDGLYETYARILAKIEKNCSRMAAVQKVLKWTTCARRPLHIEELKEAIAFEPTDRSWDKEKIPTDGQRLIRSCGNLVVLDSDDMTVQLAHHTVQQFLLSKPKRHTSDQFHFQLEQADINVGEICVAYLSFSDFETQIAISTPRSTELSVTLLDSVASNLHRIPSLLGFGDLARVPSSLMRFPSRCSYRATVRWH